MYYLNVFDAACRYTDWAQHGWRGDNADLFGVLATILMRRGGSVRFVKVKGHAKDEDVESGRVTPLDKHGNDSADSLARAGADAHAVPPVVVEQYAARRLCAKEVQCMMVRILQRRKIAEERLALPEATEEDEQSLLVDCIERVGPNPMLHGNVGVG